MMEARYPELARRTALLGQLSTAGDARHALMVLALSCPNETLETAIKLLESKNETIRKMEEQGNEIHG